MSVTQVVTAILISFARAFEIVSYPLFLLQAIKIFAEARPPGIYKPEYIEALYACYHERKPEKFGCPGTPDWKRSSDLDLNGEAMPDEDDDGNIAAPGHVRTGSIQC